MQHRGVTILLSFIKKKKKKTGLKKIPPLHHYIYTILCVCTFARKKTSFFVKSSVRENNIHIAAIVARFFLFLDHALSVFIHI